MSERATSTGAMCIPNISAAGRRRRTQFSVVSLLVAAGAFAVMVVLEVNPLWRMLAGLPVAAAVATYLQVTRNTCVAHARAGTIEHDDFSTTQAPVDQVEASRRVANGILLDGALAGLVAAAVFWASSWVM